jgi:hypothetical protein
MQPDKIFASKRLGTSYIPVSLESGATVRVKWNCHLPTFICTMMMICPFELSVNTVASARWLSVDIHYVLHEYC